MSSGRRRNLLVHDVVNIFLRHTADGAESVTVVCTTCQMYTFTARFSNERLESGPVHISIKSEPTHNVLLLSYLAAGVC